MDKSYLSNWRKRFGYWQGGYWISPDGDIIGVQDHFKYLMDNYVQFGVSKEELQGVSWSAKGEDREKFLVIGMQHGWIRVREHGGYQTFEYWKMDDWTNARIQMFLKQTNAFPQDTLLLSELSRKNVNTLSVWQLKDASKLAIKFAFNLSRVWKYFEEKNFGIVSAYKGDLPEEENESRARKLKAYLRKMNYGYKEIYGVWKAPDGTVVIEYPLFIPNLTKDDAIKIGNDEYLPEAERHPQDAVIVADGEKVLLLYMSGQVVEWDKMEVGFKEGWEAWSELKKTREKNNPRKGIEWRYYSSVEWHMNIPSEEKGWVSSIIKQSFLNDLECSTYDREWIKVKERR